MIDSQGKTQVRIVEVGPRDGLQNEKVLIDIADKFHYIELLIQAGLKNIEVSSFVNPLKVPQMQDASGLFNKLNKLSLDSSIRLFGLVPNMQGLNAAINCAVKDIAVFNATSETFNLKNRNSSIADSLIKTQAVIDAASKKKINIRGYVSTVFGCPYEGITSYDQLKKICEFYVKNNITDISLGDTNGIATPFQVKKVIQALKQDFDLSFFSMHFHDTRGMAAANVMASFDDGIRSFDSSNGGLGGCPFAKGSSGNFATEDLVYLFSQSECQLDVDLDKLLIASKYILSLLQKTSSSKLVALSGI